jgi:peptide/nickel transport system substrate-binding protein
VVTNETTAANLLLSGGLNGATISGADRARLGKAHLFNIVSTAQPNELFFNENPGHPAANPAIRKAIVEALNLNQLGQVVTSGRGAKMTQLSLQNFTPCPGDSVTGNVPANDPSGAKSVLSSPSSRSMKLLYPTDGGPSYPPAAELAQQQLAAAGAKVTLDGKTVAKLQGTIFGTGDWDILLIGIGVSTPAQFSSFVSGPTPPHGINLAGIDNARYEQATAQAIRRAGAAGCKYWLEADASLFQSADIAPLQVTTTATYGRGVTFKLGVQGILPTSLRLRK